MKKAGSTQGIGWADTSGAADSRDIPNHILTCSAYKAGGKKEVGRAQSDAVCLPKSPFQVLELCFSGESQAPTSPWEGMNSFFCFACVDFGLPIKLSLSQPSQFSFSNSFPHPSSN